MRKKQSSNAQISMLEPLIVDNFAGLGGASIGIELATGRVVDIAVNHSEAAIRMHRTNHPYTRHLQESVWDIDPIKECADRPVALAWFSPDCKHFSKAKGGKPKDKHIRGLAWVAVKWAALVRPGCIMLENVEEFQKWGPLNRRHHPIKAKEGQTFRRFVQQLRDLGYSVEWRELVAADYGAPTIRKRFVLIARCDGLPIVWPERTHAPRNSSEVRSGKCKPWRGACEIIDWSLPCPSIFASKAEIRAKYGVDAIRPLADNTQRRVIRGVDKFTIRSADPFIVPVGYGERAGQKPRVHDIREPAATAVGSSVKQYLCRPVVSPCVLQNKFDNAPQSVKNPMTTITAVNAHEIVTAQLAQYHTERAGEYARGYDLTPPLPTVDGANRYAAVTANLVEYFSTGRPLPIDEPMHTATSRDREAVVLTHIAEFKGSDLGQGARDPLRTVTAGGGQFAAVRTTVVKYEPGADLGYWPEIRALLNRHCGYELKGDELLLIGIRGAWYYIRDIGLRMLTPRELADSMGFPHDFEIERDYTGKVLKKKEIVAGIGNAVSPPMATALIRANLPQLCGEKLETMAELERSVAV